MDVQAISFRNCCGYLIHLRRRGLPALALLLLGIAGLGWVVLQLACSRSPNLPTYVVRSQPFQQTLTVRGYLAAAEQSDIVCRVRGLNRGSRFVTTIKWIIEDGTPVKRGQLLVELDDSALQEEIAVRRIWLNQAWAAQVQAEEEYKIAQWQAEDDMLRAKVAVDLATLDILRYLKGEYEQTHKDLLSQISLAETELQMWHERAGWSARMARKGYVEGIQAQSDAARLDSARMALEKLAEELRVLEKYKKKRTLAELEGRLALAKQELDRVRRQSRARLQQAHSLRLARQGTYQRRQQRLRELEEDARQCYIYAPHDGLVVYEVPPENRWGNGSQQPVIAQGEPVSYGQRLLTLPDLSKLVVRTHIHEALVSRIRGEKWQSTGFGDGILAALLVGPDPWTRFGGILAFDSVRGQLRDREYRKTYPGQKAVVRLDADPERTYQAHVQEVAVLGSYDSWTTDVESYEAVLALDELPVGARPDLSADVTIFLNEGNEKTLVVPRQSLYGPLDQGRHRKCLVVTARGIEERVVTVGLHDEEWAEITAGLLEGEEIVLTPRALRTFGKE